MKYIVILFLLTLVACTEQPKDNGLKRENQELTEALESCKQQLSSARDYSTPNALPAAPQEPEEPTCYEVNYDTLYVNSKKLDTCRSEEVVAHECGVNANNCDSGYAYACLKDVTYKTETKKICE